MELRALEKEVNDMATLYEGLRRTKLASTEEGDGELRLPPILVDNIPSEIEEEEKSLADILLMLESTRERLTGLDPKMERFRKRLSEVRPKRDLQIMHDCCALFVTLSNWVPLTHRSCV